MNEAEQHFGKGVHGIAGAIKRGLLTRLRSAEF
jgi:hypothetical protein